MLEHESVQKFVVGPCDAFYELLHDFVQWSV